MILYGDVQLDQPTDEAAAWIAENIDPRWPFDFVEKAWPGPGLAFLDGPLQWLRRPVRINSLTWPTGASRFSIGYFLADYDQVTRLRALSYPNASTWQPLPMLIQDGDNSQLITYLYMLPPRPLQQITVANRVGDRVTHGTTPTAVYLLTLVDDRYLYWFRPGKLTVDEGITTWAQLYEQIAILLSITLVVDVVPAAYLFPPVDFALQYEPLPLILDAMGFSVNQTFVRQIDGTCRMWNATASVAQQAANMATIGFPPLNLINKQAGGTFQIGGTP